MIATLNLILKRYGVHVSRNRMKATVESTPYNDTLYGFQLILERFGIPSYGMKCIGEINSIEDTDCPLVIKLRKEFVLVTKICNNCWQVWSNGKEKYLSFDDIRGQWNGILLQILKESPNIERRMFNKSFLNTVIKFMIFIMILFLIFVFCNKCGVFQNRLKLYHLMLASLGIFVSFQIILKEAGYSNKFLNICKIGTSDGCQESLKSRYSTIFSEFHLSVLCLSYFFTDLIIVLLMGEFIYCLPIFTITSLPFTIWSIFCQKYIIKEWCMLCLFVDVIIWIQTIFFLYNFPIPTFDINSVWGLSIILSMFCVFTFIFNQYYDKYNKTQDNIERILEINLIKTNTEFMNNIIPVKKSLNLNNTSGIVFGHKNAKWMITVVISLNCKTCAMVHEELNKIKKGDVCIRYLFFATNKQSHIANAIVSCYLNDGFEKCWEILSLWFSQNRNIALKYLSEIKCDNSSKEEISRHIEWITAQSIIGTPTVFVNDRKLNFPYTLSDYYLIH